MTKDNVMIPGIKYYIEKYPSGPNLGVVIYGRVSIVWVWELISAQFQGALVQARFPWLRLLPNRSGIVARWIRSGWRMPGSLLDLWFALDMQAWLWQGDWCYYKLIHLYII